MVRRKAVHSCIVKIQFFFSFKGKPGLKGAYVFELLKNTGVSQPLESVHPGKNNYEQERMM